MPRGIDCPEKGQAFGKRPKQAASELVFVKDVILQTHGYNKYRRTLGVRDPIRWYEHQGVRHAELVLVVLAVCARGYGAGRAREGSERGQERLVGGSASGAAVGVAEATQVVLLGNLSPVF